MKRQTSGCIRRERAEEDAEVGGDGGVAVEEVLQAGEAGVARVAALGRLGELHLVADEDQVPGREPTATALARETCPASSMKR